MKITQDTIVTVRYQVRNAQGKLLEDGREPTAYLHGGYGNTFAPVEAALAGQEAGYQVTLTLSPEEAFGPRDESLARTIPRSEFPPGVKLGGQLRGYTDQGHEQVFTVVKIKGPVVHLDGNHPLAGQALQFTVTVLGVRAATAEEVAHRHAHGEHGHHHA